MFDNTERWIAVVHYGKTQNVLIALSTQTLPMKFSVINGRVIVG